MTSIENSAIASLSLLLKDLGSVRSVVNAEKDDIFNSPIKHNLIERIETIFNRFIKISRESVNLRLYVEFKLSLNDLLTQVIFLGLEKGEDVECFIQMKDQLLTSYDSSSQSNILETIKQKLLKAFKQEDLESIWALRTYRILIEAWSDSTSFFELDPSSISTSKIVLCAKNILSRERRSASRKLTTRRFDMVIAAKLLLNRLNSRLSNKYYFSFNELAKTKEDIFGINDQIVFLNIENSEVERLEGKSNN